MKKKLFALAALVAALGSTAGTASAQDVLTGDTRLACEAILCLSSGTRPSECTPSLSRYFNITKRKLSDTIRARLTQFLFRTELLGSSDNLQIGIQISGRKRDEHTVGIAGQTDHQAFRDLDVDCFQQFLICSVSLSHQQSGLPGSFHCNLILLDNHNCVLLFTQLIGQILPHTPEAANDHMLV